MTLKVRITTHRGNGSTSGPVVGLTDARLALVERYMIDAEEAEARTQTATARAEPLVQHVAEKQAPREVEEVRREAEPAQRRAEELRRDAQPAQRTAEERLLRAAATELDLETADPLASPTARREAHTHTTLAKTERQAAKQAARVLAAMEKKEARERKALARAAAKRAARARKGRGNRP